jgi:molybdopterin converting factor subunit 1
MQIHIRYFAALREGAGRDAEPLELPEGADVATARALLADRYPPISALLPRCATAVNRAYVPLDTALHAGDELVFIPPVGGG